MSEETINILCYGDSNTYGFDPATRGRYPRSVRWTGVLQRLLGSKYFVIENGLTSRTTMWDDPKRDHRNGRKTLGFVLDTSLPLDLVILSLGANDTKTLYNQSSLNIALGIEVLIRTIQERPWYDEKDIPKILVVSPPTLTDAVYLDNPFSTFDASSVMKSLELAKRYKSVCEFNDADFLDGSLITQVGPDGLHLSPEGHKRMAERLSWYVSTEFGSGY